MAEQHVVVLVTVNNHENASKIADTLLERRKVACVNIVFDIESRYWWKGKLEKDEEFLLIIKTRAELVKDVITLVKSVHPAELPEIIALPILSGNQFYLDWIDEETRKPRPMV